MTYEKSLIASNPEIILDLAVISSSENTIVTPDWFYASVDNIHLLKNFLDRNPQHVFNRIISIVTSKCPSKGIEFLRSIGALKVILPELDACFGVKQNPAYHSFDVYTHCIMACDKAEGSTAVKLAALLHDIGKPAVKKEIDGRITFHKHEYESVKLIKNIFKRYRVDNDMATDVIFLVSNHMYQYDRVWKDSTVLRFVEKVGLLDNNNNLKDMSTFPLFQLRKADRSGRGLAPNTEKQNDFEERIRSVVLKQKNLG